jgi:pimeloyl-ACP methyl ester carboxylesterase
MIPDRQPGLDAGPRIVQSRRGGVECAVWGEGPAVLALHGAMGGYDQGLLLARTTVGRPDFRFVAVSRPGYLGTSLACGRTPEEQADRCAEVLDALGIGRAAAMAISGGGQCALQFALRYPERCWGLVMISACSAPITERLPLRFHMFKLMARFPAFAARIRKKAEQDPDAAARRAIPDDGVRARTLADPEAGALFRALTASTMDRMEQRMPGTVNDVRQSRRPFDYPLERIVPPLLVVHGTADRAAPFAAGKALAGKVPGAEILAIEGGEHVSIFTHRSEILPRVTQFLRAHAPAEASAG